MNAKSGILATSCKCVSVTFVDMTAIQRVQFSGINRNVDEGVSADGQCMELINARISHGSVEPIGRPIPIASLGIDGIRGMYWHAMVGKYIVTTDKAVYSVSVDEATHAVTSTTITGVENVTDVQFIGYVACLISDKIEYAIYDGSELSGYKVLGTAPTLPRLYFTVDNKELNSREDNICIASDTADGNKYFNGRENKDVPIKNTVDYASSGGYKKIQSTLNKQGVFAGVTFVLVRYALRLSTGDYAYHSPIILLDGNKLTNVGSYAAYYDAGAVSDSYMRTGRFICYMGDSAKVDAYKNVNIKCSTAGFKLGVSGASNLSAWNGLVTGLDVFVAPISNYKEMPYSDNYDKYAPAYTVLRLKSTSEIAKEIGETSTFYKYASFDINGNKIWQVDDVSMDNLTVQDKLTDDGYTHNSITGVSYVYNSRLHIGGITETFFDGYDNDYNIQGTNITPTAGDNMTIYTYVNTQQGMIVVKRESTAPTDGINPYLCYPDSRAVKMVISKGGKVYQKDLTAHGSLNLAYSYGSPTVGVEDSNKVLTGNLELDNVISSTQYYYSVSPLQTSTSVDTPKVNDTIKRNNVLKVSALNNPIYYPPEQTYQPCNGTVMGMCSNTAALSQGQFGQYPLYVFCDDGVFALSVGTNGVAYASQSPVTRDVCTNSKSIAGADSEVVFASQKGLMAIRGAQVQLLSEDMDGYLPSCVDSSPIIGKVIDVAKMSNAVSSVEFRTYIEGASVAYNYEGGLLYVSNHDYSYMYCYDLKSQSWCKMSPNMAVWVNRYPQCYAVSDDGWLYDMQNSHRCISQILLLSRPIKFGSTSYKRILQTALRGIVKRSKSDLYLRGEAVKFRDERLILFEDVGMYVLGSNDAEHFTLINGREQIADIRDLVTRMTRAKAWKYFMVCLAGGVRTDVSVNTVEFTIDVTYNNRLR